MDSRLRGNDVWGTMEYNLEPHPYMPPRAIPSVTVNFSRFAYSDDFFVQFRVDCAEELILPEPTKPERKDGLWHSTCFELFVKPDGSDAYFEFNFSPSREWAGYRFDTYRTGMRPIPMSDPEIDITEKPDQYFLLGTEALPEFPNAVLEVPDVPLHIGLSAVIEEKDGTKSYWALAHPPGDPDFHHPDCFALKLPARERS